MLMSQSRYRVQPGAGAEPKAYFLFIAGGNNEDMATSEMYEADTLEQALAHAERGAMRMRELHTLGPVPIEVWNEGDRPVRVDSGLPKRQDAPPEQVAPEPPAAEPEPEPEITSIDDLPNVVHTDAETEPEPEPAFEPPKPEPTPETKIEPVTPDEDRPEDVVDAPGEET